MEKAWYRLKIFLTRFAYFKKRSRIKRYGFPLLLTLAASLTVIASKNAYVSVISGEVMALLLLTLIVTLSSWYGGLGPGIVATAFAATVNFFIFLSQDRTPGLEDKVLTAIFILEGLIISIISEARYQSERQKSDFIGFAAHELKNPLSSIKGFADLIQQRAQKIQDQKTFSFAQKIQSQSNKMLELIDDLLDVTKIEVGKFTYKEEYFDFDALVEEVFSHQRITAEGRIITLSGKSKKLIYGDRYRIGQVITNLLTNALKYSPLNSKVALKVAGQKNRVVLRVRDNGIGLSKAEQNMIFEQFFRSAGAQREKPGGLGLGLFICSQIIKHHGGKLSVKSLENRGSTFFMELPIRRNSDGA